MLFNNIKVLIVGDVMLDRWVYLKKTKNSPEAPVPVVEELNRFSQLGGAANALRHLNNLSSGEHFLIGLGGNDLTAAEIAEAQGLLSKQMALVIDSSRKSTLKERYLVDSVPFFRRDDETVSDISSDIAKNVVAEVINRISKFDVLLLSDYSKGLLSSSVIEAILELAANHNLPVVSDPGLGRVGDFLGSTVIKPNAIEWKVFVETKSSETAAIAELFSGGTKNIVITNGKNGIRHITEKFDIIAAPGKEIDAVDVTGAGDSIAAAVSLLVGSKHSIKSNLQFLNMVGGLTVSQVRTELPNLLKLEVTDLREENV
jgi:rfaE bifunctional protein kinase chain/domain